MELRGVEIVESPSGRGWARLQGTVAYERREYAPERYWFDVPSDCADALRLDGNAWVPCLLPLAVKFQERLRLPVPVDPVLLDGAAELMRVWQCWYPHARPVALEAAPGTPEPGMGGRTGALFSGGVDSYYTVLRQERRWGPPPFRPVDDLLTIWGFDVPWHEEERFAPLGRALAQAAERMGKRLVIIRTNLMTTQFWRCDFWELGWGAALLGPALVLGARYGRLLIASDGGYRYPVPSGSHPLTDPLYSTSATTVVHDGSECTRLEKSAWVAQSPLALGGLRVCWTARGALNCGTCSKCLRTMLMLELRGVLGKCATLPGRLDLARVGRIHLVKWLAAREFDEVAELATARGRADIAAAVRRSLRRSRWRATWIRRARVLAGVRGLGGLAGAAQRLLLAGMVR